jgi:hypothetical protein
VLLGDVGRHLVGAREREELGVRDTFPQGVHLVDVKRPPLRERRAGDEEDRRHAEPVEHRNGELGLAAEAVVEGDDARALRQRDLARDRCEQLVARDEFVRAANQLELRGESVDRDREDRARLGRRLGRDVVVTDGEEDEAR